MEICVLLERGKVCADEGGDGLDGEEEKAVDVEYFCFNGMGWFGWR